MRRYLYAMLTGAVLGVFLFGAIPVLADTLGGGGNYGIIEAFSGVASTATSSTACVADSVVYDNNGVQGCVKLSDVAAQPLTVHPQHAYAQGTNQGSDLMLAAGAGIKKVTIDAFANCTAGDNIVIMVNVGGTSTSTTLTYGTEWCSGACGTDAATATSLAAAIDALAGVSSVAVGAVAYVTLDLNTAAVAFTSESDATCTTVSNGTDGNVKLASTGVLQWTGRANDSSPAAAKRIWSNAAATVDLCFDFATDSTLKLYNGDCSTVSAAVPRIETVAAGLNYITVYPAGALSGSSWTSSVYTDGIVTKNELVLTSSAGITCADSGDANPGVCSFGATVNQISRRVVTCNDAHGCTLAMLETGAEDGQIMVITVASANTVTIADSAGVSEMSGAAVLGQYDAVTLQYVTDRWIQLAPESDN